LSASIPLGIVAGLFFGKQLGVFAVANLATFTGLADRPEGVSLWQLYGVSILTGIGFTMSLFIGTLAFEETAMDQVRLGALAGSLLSAALAAVILAACGRSRFAPDE